MEKNEEWHDGFPKEQGWYECLLDGEIVLLRHFECCVSTRHEWAHPGGEYEYGNVKWRGGRVR